MEGVSYQIPGTLKKLSFSFFNDLLFLFLFQGGYQRASHTSKVLKKRGIVKKRFLTDLLTHQIWMVNPNVPPKVEH